MSHLKQKNCSECCQSGLFEKLNSNNYEDCMAYMKKFLKANSSEVMKLKNQYHACNASRGFQKYPGYNA